MRTAKIVIALILMLALFPLAPATSFAQDDEIPIFLEIFFDDPAHGRLRELLAQEIFLIGNTKIVDAAYFDTWDCVVVSVVGLRDECGLAFSYAYGYSDISEPYIFVDHGVLVCEEADSDLKWVAGEIIDEVKLDLDYIW